jgi:hypothetical protein
MCSHHPHVYDPQIVEKDEGALISALKPKGLGPVVAELPKRTFLPVTLLHLTAQSVETRAQP